MDSAFTHLWICTQKANHSRIVTMMTTVMKKMMRAGQGLMMMMTTSEDCRTLALQTSTENHDM